MNMSRLKTIIVGLGGLLIIFSAAVSANIIISRSNEIVSLRQTLWQDAINERMNNVFTMINAFPGSAGKDLLFLKTLTGSNDLRNFIENSEAYKEIIAFRSDGTCEFRITKPENSNEGCAALPVFLKEIFARAKQLGPSETYISSLTLYENSPTLFYATKRDGGGIIISVIDANYFLEEIRRLNRSDEVVYLLLSDGSYLANPDRSKEKLAGSNATFYRDFPEIPSNMLADNTTPHFETPADAFTFWRIYPTESNFALYKGSSKVLGQDHERQYFWIMAAVSTKPPQTLWWQDYSIITALAGLAAMHLIVLFIVYFFVLRSGVFNYEK